MTRRTTRGPLLLIAAMLLPAACASTMTLDAEGVPVEEECETQL